MILTISWVHYEDMAVMIATMMTMMTMMTMVTMMTMMTMTMTSEHRLPLSG